MNETTHRSTDPSTAQRLITAARKAFGDKGYEAASVREITAAAGANLGAVTYHFGSKHALYEAVIEAVFDSVVGRVTAAVRQAANRPPLERIEALVREFFAAIRDNPDFQFLLLQQAVRHRPPAAALRRVPAMFGLIGELIREGQADGSIRAGSPPLMAVSVVAQPAYFALVLLLLLPRLAAGALPLSSSWQEIAEHAVLFVHAGLAAQGEET
jgi:AcrR family transcriptional regulator